MEPPPGKGSAWKVNWQTCSETVQESLTFLRLAFQLRRAVDDVDFVAVRCVVGSAWEADLLEHPLFMQSLELLERVGASEPTRGTSCPRL